MTTTAKPDFAVTLPASVPALSIADTEIRGTAEALGAVLDVRSRALPALDQIVKNLGTNDLGKVEAWTDVAEGELPKLYTARAKAEADRVVLEAKLAQVEAAARVPLTTSPIERTDQWETGKWFAAQAPAKRQELTEAMVRGEQVSLRDRLLALPEYACPLSAPLRAMFEREQTAARIDQATLTRLQTQAEIVNTVSRQLAAHITAFEGSADRSRLRAKGVDIPKGRGEMDDTEKSEFITAKGLDAFMALSA
jgi:hypothetical protein